MTDPEIAEALDLLGIELPGAGSARGAPPGQLFEDLFLRFQARVPFREGAGPLSPEELLSRWAAAGEGGGPSSRTGALLVLARALGFEVEPVAVRSDAHGAPAPVVRPVLLARLGPAGGGRRVVADAGLPMPGLLPLDGPPVDGFPTGYGRVRAEVRDREATLTLAAFGGEEELWRSDLAPMPVPSFPPDPTEEPGEAGPRLFRLLDDRVLRWEGGRLRVDDAWGRLDIPFAPGRTVLEELFAQPLADGDGEAAARKGGGAPTLTVREGRDGDAARIRALLSSPEGHAALLPPGLVARGTEPSGDGWSWTLATEDGAFVRRERVRTGAGEPLATVATVETIEGTGPFSVRRYTVEERPGAWRVLLAAELAGEIPPRGLAEGTRKALAFALVSEILALPED